ncbi:hypothetical protein evm_003029 [Chilo suppressalis]|nr:hypothetical protein evm_003029 [Chilo suppressalis]
MASASSTIDHVPEFRRKLKWLPIRLRRVEHVLTLLYNVLYDPRTPPYLKERFKFLDRGRSPTKSSFISEIAKEAWLN